MLHAVADDAPTPVRLLFFFSGAFSNRQSRAPENSLPSKLASFHSGLRSRQRGGSGINHAPCWLLSCPCGPLWGRTCGPGRSPRRLQSSSPAGPRGRPCTALLAGSESFCLCVVRVVTVTKPPATWPSILPGWWLRHPWPGQGSLKCAEVAVLGLGCRGGVGTNRR